MRKLNGKNHRSLLPIISMVLVLMLTVGCGRILREGGEQAAKRLASETSEIMASEFSAVAGKFAEVDDLVRGSNIKQAIDVLVPLGEQYPARRDVDLMLAKTYAVDDRPDDVLRTLIKIPDSSDEVTEELIPIVKSLNTELSSRQYRWGVALDGKNNLVPAYGLEKPIVGSQIRQLPEEIFDDAMIVYVENDPRLMERWVGISEQYSDTESTRLSLQSSIRSGLKNVNTDEIIARVEIVEIEMDELAQLRLRHVYDLNSITYTGFVHRPLLTYPRIDLRTLRFEELYEFDKLLDEIYDQRKAAVTPLRILFVRYRYSEED